MKNSAFFCQRETQILLFRRMQLPLLLRLTLLLQEVDYEDSFWL
uniref:Dynein cytoplasmic 2 heavy chain 1 n=1 Tax=Pipistrellus kuhlii TaxID=59472 RepID=A0A7J7WZC2_PIPKU|nr:dynein cytoplasmic 2 heavy chain 1 [Pipistrellus kuhlii]